MSTECYYGGCKYHESNDSTEDNGPFCHEPKCKATPNQLAEHERARHIYLNNVNWVDIPNQK